MDISKHLGSNFLNHLDLTQPFQTYIIKQVTQQMIGNEQKICVTFVEFASKPLALNKTNLTRLGQMYGMESNNWIGKPLLVYRSMTTYEGRTMPCIRICGPHQAPPDLVCDQRGNPVVSQHAAPQVSAPVTAPQFAQPVAAPQVNPVLHQPVPPQQPQAAWSPASTAPPQGAFPQAGQQPVAAPQQSAAPVQPQVPATPWQKNTNSPPSA